MLNHFKKYYWRDTEGFIYLAASTLTPYVKIGFARNVPHRIKTLRRKCRLPDLIAVGAIAGSPTQERDIHRHLASYRVVGEWFLPVSGCRDIITRLFA